MSGLCFGQLFFAQFFLVVRLRGNREQVPDSPFPFAGSAFTLWGKVEYSLHSAVSPNPPQFEVVSMLQLKYISPNNIDSPSLVL